MKTFDPKGKPKSWSIEITPKESKTISCFSTFLDRDTKVNVTNLPKTSVTDIFATVRN